MTVIDVKLHYNSVGVVTGGSFTTPPGDVYNIEGTADSILQKACNKVMGMGGGDWDVKIIDSEGECVSRSQAKNAFIKGNTFR